ncbi:MAG: hypothetical protein V1811_02080 [Candidatus Micrarchaeota archaeon]
MGFIEDFVKIMMESLTRTVKRFTAFSLILFFLGALYGVFMVPRLVEKGILDPVGAVLAPFVLAVLSYYFVEIATVIFIALLLILLFVFI